MEKKVVGPGLVPVHGEIRKHPDDVPVPRESWVPPARSFPVNGIRFPFISLRVPSKNRFKGFLEQGAPRSTQMICIPIYRLPVF